MYQILTSASPVAKVQGTCALAVMTKAPRAGKVKTRLVPPLTDDQAAQLSSCFLQDTAAAIRQVSMRSVEEIMRRTLGVAVYTPVGAEREYGKILPSEFLLVPQRGEDFGDRLAFAVEDLFAIGFESVCLIDSDSPTVSAENYAKAVKSLTKPGNRIVLGPSDDGGYYLIGLKKRCPHLFERIDWSTDRVLQQTRERATELKVEVSLLPAGYDVDNEAALRRLCDDLLESEADWARDRAPATAAFLRELVTQQGKL